ncbi:MOSC domain protein [Bacillus methanolicus MGA3]|nr:MOSC domain protein [Bacillus methanolicus MGA3]
MAVANKRQLRSLRVGMPKDYIWNGKEVKSGIGKTEIQEVLLTKEGFIGDGVANPEFHGGPERAVCLYPFEHYEKWEKEFSATLKMPAFGENITVSGMCENEVYIGDIYKLEEAVIQVSQGRIPCSTISKHNGIEQLMKRVVETGFTGYFFRVLKEGMLIKNQR